MKKTGFLTATRLGVMTLTVLLRVSTSLAQAPVYTLEECLKMGLQHAGHLQNAFRDEQIAETTIGQIRAQILPQLSATAMYSRLDPQKPVEFGDQSLTIGSEDNYSAGLSLRQLLYSGGSVLAGLRAAKDFRSLTEHQTARIRAGLVRDIHAGFNDLLLLKAVIGVHEQTVTQLRELSEQTEARFRQDRAAEFEVLNARVQWANAVPDLLRASNDWSIARAAFANLINLPEPEFSIRGDLVFVAFEEPLESLVTRALRDRPEILAMQQRLALQQSEVRAERGAYLPTLHAVAAYTGQDPADMIASDDGWEWRWSIGIQAQWNWLDGGLRGQRVRQKILEREKTLEHMAMLYRNVELEVRQGWLRVEHAAAAVAASRENVALATKAVQIAQARFASGLTTRLEYTDVSLSLMRAQLHRLQALRDHLHAVNEVHYLTGAY